MKKFDLVTVLLVIAAFVATWFYFQQRAPDPAPVGAADQEMPAEVTLDEPEIRHPVPEVTDEQEAPAEPAEPLPPLDQSDEVLQQRLDELATPLEVGEMIVFKNLIRHVVVTLDNIPRDKLPLQYRPTEPLSGQFMVRGDADEARFIDPRNYRRYEPYVRLAEAVDPGQLAALYVRFYPLFQQAYEDLGYPDRYFNDRLIEVIDHLLDTPGVDGPVRLVRPHVFYQFANPELEALSAGQKVLIRMGEDNANRIKARLRELRRVLTSDQVSDRPGDP